MIGKLLKYNLRSCLRHMWPFWLAMMALSVINGVVGRFNFGGESAGFLMKGFPVLLLVISGFVTFFVTLIYICSDFYNGLLGTPGYLMFTLPVKTSGLILSKCMTAIVLEVISFLVAGICGVLLLMILAPAGLTQAIKSIFDVIVSGRIPGTAWLLTAELIIMFLTLAASFNTQIYAAAAIGQMFGRNRLALSFIAYVFLGILTSMTVTWSARLFDRILPRISIGFMSVSFQSVGEGFTGACKVAGIVIFFNLIISSVFYTVSRLILDRKLNLE